LYAFLVFFWKIWNLSFLNRLLKAGRLIIFEKCAEKMTFFGCEKLLDDPFGEKCLGFYEKRPWNLG